MVHVNAKRVRGKDGVIRRYFRAQWTDGTGRRHERILGPMDGPNRISQRTAESRARAMDQRLSTMPRRAPGSIPTLGEWCKEHASDYARTHASSGASLMQYATTALIAHFGAEAELDSITRDDAARFRAAYAGSTYRRSKKTDAKTYQRSASTVAAVMRYCRVVMQAAVERDLIPVNPFDRMQTRTSRGKKTELDETVSKAVLEHLPGPEAKALFGVCRFAGLRCPSETSMLTWGDVLDDALIVASPKTTSQDDRQAGHWTRRRVPMDGRLAPIIAAWRAAAGPCRPAEPVFRMTGSQITSAVRTAARAAGVAPWPKLMHSLRSTWEHELRALIGTSAAAEIMGHSVDVAKQHYLTGPSRLADADAAKIVAKSWQTTPATPTTRRRKKNASPG